MTKFQKQMLTIAAAGALTAVTALPAMAFENEFHGIYNFNTVFSNYNNGGGGDFSPSGVTVTQKSYMGNDIWNVGTVNNTTGAITFPAATANKNAITTFPWGDKRKMNNYLEQRTRLQYTAKASDDLKLVTHFEINNRFGSGKDGNGGGADLDADGLNIVTKWAFLDFNVGKSFNTKVGLMPYKDTIKGLFIDADVPAIYTTTKAGSYTLGLGFSRFADDQANGIYLVNQPVTYAGQNTKDLFIMDNTLQLSKDTKVGLSYYFYNDNANSAQSYSWNGYAQAAAAGTTQLNANTQQTKLHVLGLSGETKLGGINLSGFAAMQAGSTTGIVNNYAAAAPYYGRNSSINHHGWAANFAAKGKLGIGTARTAFLFASGGNTNSFAQNNGWVTSSVNSYNESGMMILARNTYNSPTSTDAYMRRNVTNIALATIGYDAQLTEKFNLNTNVGFAWAPSSNDAPVDQKAKLLYGLTDNQARNGSDYMGTEINLEAGYQLYKNLKLQAQAGYVILGGYYKNSTYNPGMYYNAATNSYIVSAVNATNIVNPENPYTMRLQARYSF